MFVFTDTSMVPVDSDRGHLQIKLQSNQGA